MVQWLNHFLGRPIFPVFCRSEGGGGAVAHVVSREGADSQRSEEREPSSVRDPAARHPATPRRALAARPGGEPQRATKSATAMPITSSATTTTPISTAIITTPRAAFCTPAPTWFIALAWAIMA